MLSGTLVQMSHVIIAAICGDCDVRRVSASATLLAANCILVTVKCELVQR